MPQDSYQQAIAREAMGRLRRDPKLLSRMESGIVKGVLQEFIDEIIRQIDAGKVVGGEAANPDSEVTLSAIQASLTLAILEEFVRIPAEPSPK